MERRTFRSHCRAEMKPQGAAPAHGTTNLHDLQRTVLLDALLDLVAVDRSHREHVLGSHPRHQFSRDPRRNCRFKSVSSNYNWLWRTRSEKRIQVRSNPVILAVQVANSILRSPYRQSTGSQWWSRHQGGNFQMDNDAIAATLTAGLLGGSKLSGNVRIRCGLRGGARGEGIFPGLRRS
jgi:hypothetical protein